MLGSLILYLRGMRIMMFQLSGFYCSILRNVFLFLLSQENITVASLLWFYFSWVWGFRAVRCRGYKPRNGA